MDVNTVTVVGAGTMGAGIAQVCAQAGYDTHLVDANAVALERGMQRIEEFWAKGIAKGKTTEAQRSHWRSRLNASTDAGAAAGSSQVVIEAVPEDLRLKQKVFAQVDKAAPDGALLASNTSSLSVAAIAGATKRPGCVLGLHFFNPVPLMQLLEIVRHDDTDPGALGMAQEVGKRLGKTTIVVRDSPGFATSRLGIVLGNEAMRMLEEGIASARDIDTAMRLGYGHPMGPLELSDLVGLDVRADVGDYLYSQFKDGETKGDHYRSPDLLRRLVKAGDLGKKVGRGFYDWSDGTPRERRLP
ncbi:MAG TPA: 3-hydroxyacyl-CoA dehydrogenase family protein [Candidatus Thermoplasmatota archaeon]|nr:3-hydroxyacyl-CoA dehydrogenase family protein [Candidatus Thermoplasmatota archaeon]